MTVRALVFLYIVSLSDEGIKMFSVTQALFAGSIPEIIDIVKMFPKYNGTYVNDRGRRHVTLYPSFLINLF